MYLFITGIFAHVWIHYSFVIISLVFWGLIGMVIVSPVFLADAIYQGQKLGRIYHINRANHLRRRKYNREALFYSTVTVCSVVALLIIHFA